MSEKPGKGEGGKAGKREEGQTGRRERAKLTEREEGFAPVQSPSVLAQLTIQRLNEAEGHSGHGKSPIRIQRATVAAWRKGAKHLGAVSMVRSGPISNHEWPRMSTARRSRNHLGVRGLVRAFGRRLVAVECGNAFNFPGPLDAALLWRQVAKAAKAVTSHRTRNSCRLCAKFRHCSTNRSRSSRGNEAQTKRAESPKENSPGQSEVKRGPTLVNRPHKFSPSPPRTRRGPG